MSSTNGSKPKQLESVDAEIVSSRAICGAKKRNNRGICKARPMENGRCYNHGGPTPKGFAAPAFKHGRHSKYMPSGLADKYRTALADPELTHLRDEIALIDVHLGETLERLHAGESGEFWTRSRELLADYRKAIQGQAADGYDGPEPDAILNELDALLASGRRTLDIFSEIQPMLEQRRKTAESENKRLTALNQTMTAEEALGFARAVGDAVKRHVTDQKLLTAISGDIARTLNR